MRLVIRDPSLVILCGPAGSGKSTFAARHFPPGAIVSSDRCRAMIADSESAMEVSKDAFVLFHQIIEMRLRHGRPVVADSTALSKDARHALRQLAQRAGVPVTLIIFDVREQTSARWDAQRPRRVGGPVIRQQWERFQEALREIKEEAYDQVAILGEEDLDRVQVVLAPAGGPQTALSTQKEQGG